MRATGGQWVIAAATPPEPVDAAEARRDADDERPPGRIGEVGVVSIVVLAGLAYAFARPHARLRDLLIAAAVGMPVHLLGFVAAGAIAGLTIERVSLFYGGAVLRRRVRGAWVSVGW